MNQLTWWAVWLVLATGTTRASAATAFVAVSELVNELQFRERCVATLQGDLTQRVFRNAAYREFSARVDAKLRPQGPAVAVPERSLFQVRFAVGQNRLRMESVAVVGGPNAWLNTARSTVTVADWRNAPGLLDVPPPVGEPLPATLVLDDGQRRIRWDRGRDQVTIHPAEGTGEVAVTAPFTTILLFGWGRQTVARTLAESIRKWAATATPGADPSQPATVVLSAGHAVAGVACRRLATSGLGDFVRGQQYVYVGPPELGSPILCHEVWSVWKQAGTKTLERAVALETREVAPGLWLPTHTREERFRWPVGAAAPAVQITEYRLTNLRANEPLPQELFEFRIPLGAQVIDLIQPARYVEGNVGLADARRLLGDSFPTEPWQAEHFDQELARLDGQGK